MHFVPRARSLNKLLITYLSCTISTNSPSPITPSISPPFPESITYSSSSRLAPQPSPCHIPVSFPPSPSRLCSPTQLQTSPSSALPPAISHSPASATSSDLIPPSLPRDGQLSAVTAAAAGSQNSAATAPLPHPTHPPESAAITDPAAAATQAEVESLVSDAAGSVVSQGSAAATAASSAVAAAVDLLPDLVPRSFLRPLGPLGSLISTVAAASLRMQHFEQQLSVRFLPQLLLFNRPLPSFTPSNPTKHSGTTRHKHPSSSSSSSSHSHIIPAKPSASPALVPQQGGTSGGSSIITPRHGIHSSDGYGASDNSGSSGGAWGGPSVIAAGSSGNTAKSSTNTGSMEGDVQIAVGQILPELHELLLQSQAVSGAVVDLLSAITGLMGGGGGWMQGGGGGGGGPEEDSGASDFDLTAVELKGSPILERTVRLAATGAGLLLTLDCTLKLNPSLAQALPAYNRMLQAVRLDVASYVSSPAPFTASENHMAPTNRTAPGRLTTTTARTEQRIGELQGLVMVLEQAYDRPRFMEALQQSLSATLHPSTAASRSSSSSGPAGVSPVQRADKWLVPLLQALNAMVADAQAQVTTPCSTLSERQRVMLAGCLALFAALSPLARGIEKQVVRAVPSLFTLPQHCPLLLLYGPVCLRPIEFLRNHLPAHIRAAYPGSFTKMMAMAGEGGAEAASRRAEKDRAKADQAAMSSAVPSLLLSASAAVAQCNAPLRREGGSLDAACAKQLHHIHQAASHAMRCRDMVHHTAMALTSLNVSISPAHAAHFLRLLVACKAAESAIAKVLPEAQLAQATWQSSLQQQLQALSTSLPQQQQQVLPTPGQPIPPGSPMTAILPVEQPQLHAAAGLAALFGGTRESDRQKHRHLLLSHLASLLAHLSSTVSSTQGRSIPPIPFHQPPSFSSSSSSPSSSSPSSGALAHQHAHLALLQAITGTLPAVHAGAGSLCASLSAPLLALSLCSSLPLTLHSSLNCSFLLHFPSLLPLCLDASLSLPVLLPPDLRFLSLAFLDPYHQLLVNRTTNSPTAGAAGAWADAMELAVMEHLLTPLIRDIEEDLQMHWQSVKAEHPLRMNPAKTGVHNLLQFLLSSPLPLPLPSHSLNIHHLIEARLTHALDPHPSRQSVSRSNLNHRKEQSVAAIRLLGYSKYDMHIARSTTPSPVLPSPLADSCMDVGDILELLATKAQAFSVDICAQTMAFPYLSLPPGTSSAETSLHAVSSARLVTARQLSTALTSANLLSSIQSAATSACVIIAQRLSLLLQLLSHDRLQSLLLMEKRRWGSAAGRVKTERAGEGEGGGMGGGGKDRGGRQIALEGSEGVGGDEGRGGEGSGVDDQGGYALHRAEELRQELLKLSVDVQRFSEEGGSRAMIHGSTHALSPTTPSSWLALAVAHVRAIGNAVAFVLLLLTAGKAQAVHRLTCLSSRLKSSHGQPSEQHHEEDDVVAAVERQAQLVAGLNESEVLRVFVGAFRKDSSVLHSRGLRQLHLLLPALTLHSALDRQERAGSRREGMSTGRGVPGASAVGGAGAGEDGGVRAAGAGGAGVSASSSSFYSAAGGAGGGATTGDAQCIADDGFELGLAYLLSLSNQWSRFSSLQWFPACQRALLLRCQLAASEAGLDHPAAAGPAPSALGWFGQPAVQVAPEIAPERLHRARKEMLRWKGVAGEMTRTHDLLLSSKWYFLPS